MDIYEHHHRAFGRTSAFVIAHAGKKVATIAIKYPARGGSRVYAYVHWLGVEMRRAFASYDNATTRAVQRACRLIEWPIDCGTHGPEAFTRAIEEAGLTDWQHALTEAGFDVWGAC